MNLLMLAAGLIAGLAFGWLLGMVRNRSREAESAGRIVRLEVELEQVRRETAERAANLERTAVEFQNAFKALASDALKDNNRSFLELARESFAKEQAQAKGELEKREQAVAGIVKPISESLEKVDRKIGEIEKAREQAYGALREQMKSVDSVQRQLRDETGKLVEALRAPSVRGRWGEIQLRRVVEMAGMVDHVDFTEQTTVSSEGGKLRPDLIVKLPGGKCVVVDAKAPLAAYLDAMDAKDEDARKLALVRHARQVREHVNKLGARSYSEQFSQTPEFVVMFLPGEDIFAAALRQDPSLIEEGVDRKVILATPTTLIALLRAVSYGWQQDTIAHSAQEISELGKDLYERIRVLGVHFGAVGRNLDKTVENYNKAVGSLESRVLVQARRFAELGSATTREIATLNPIEKTARILQAPDLTPGSEEDAD